MTHVYNAYEDGRNLIVEGHRSGVFGHLKSELANAPPNGDHNEWFTAVRTYVTRWTINMASGQLAEQQLNDISGDFPRINDTLIGHKHNFNYMTTMGGPERWLTETVVKHDLVRDRIETNTVKGLTSPTEGIFVPREGVTAEDDGYLLSIWWDQDADRSEVVIQNAHDFTAEPVARIKLNHRVPMGFHGNWIPAAQLDAAVLAAHA